MTNIRSGSKHLFTSVHIIITLLMCILILLLYFVHSDFYMSCSKYLFYWCLEFRRWLMYKMSSQRNPEILLDYSTIYSTCIFCCSLLAIQPPGSSNMAFFLNPLCSFHFHAAASSPSTMVSCGRNNFNGTSNLRAL